ncbi:phosphonate metabolism transcriptional regulator PhnF [Terrihabitans sp. B22-R8]|uniref:phosphonate metabolism transcriptional regulator PhnF n=1 Tax=Terrihabitans sp. B22-R8 TaxID=3425128 RepID=UPI00403CE174
MTSADLLSDPLVRGSGLAAWRQIADAIEAEIVSGQLAPGDRTPPEMQLAAQFGVNRHTVRRALVHLAQRGLVRSTQGKGTFVEPRPLPYPIGRKTRFSEVMAKAGKEARGELLHAEHVQADAQVADALGIEQGTPVLEMHSINRADGVPMSLSRTWLPLPRFMGLEEIFARKGSLTKAYTKYGLTDYRRLSTRIAARAADPEEARLLAIPAGRTLLVVSSVNVDMEGTRIQATQSRFAADRVELVIER